MPPFLIFRRTGRVIALVLAVGIGGGTVLIGTASAAAGALSAAAVWPALKGYVLVSLPFFVMGAVLWRCRRELWAVPEAKALRMLTYRPWQVKGPRVEQAPIGDYSGLCKVTIDSRAEQTSLAVALITNDGDHIPVREFDGHDAADAFLSELGDVTGLPRVVGEAPAS